MSWTKTRSQIANMKKQNPDADTTELKRQLKAERLEDYIVRTVDAAPELTSAQRARLAQLLSGGDSFASPPRGAAATPALTSGRMELGGPR